MKFVSILVSLVFSWQALAVTIEFPEEELARESVLPVFDNAVSVKSRLVPTKGRFEFGLATGFALNEPFFNTTRFGGHVAYHFTETHAVLLQAQIYTDGLGNNGNALAGTDLNNGAGETFIRMEFAPQPASHFFANYQFTPYYGKISVFKDFVMNLSLYGLVGLGTVDVGGEAAPALNLGIGQKFYFSKNWGIRADLGLMAYEGVNFFAGSDGGPSPLQDTSGSSADDVLADVPISEFDRQMNYDLHFSLALVILL
jgi:outer membrane beta-barrel protein